MLKLSKKDRLEKLTDADMKKIMPIFVDSTSPDDHKCGTCMFRIEGNKCSVMEGDISLENGTCLLWAKGKESKETAPSLLSKQTAGYVERTTPINCSTCKHYSENICNLWQKTVEPEQCCMVWEDSGNQE